MNWTIESAKQYFTELINQATQEPQPIFDDNQIVVAVINAQTFAFEELRQLCLEENYAAVHTLAGSQASSLDDTK